MKKSLLFVAIALVIGSSFMFTVRRAHAVKPTDYGLKEGDLISAIFSDDPDVYIINDQGYKRLFLNPAIFKFYGHLGGFFNVRLVTTEVKNAFPTSGLFRDCESKDPKVYGVDIDGEDSGQLHWVNSSGDQAFKDDPDFFKKVFCINNAEFNWYPKGSSLNTVKDVPKYERTTVAQTVATEKKIEANTSLKGEGKVVICHYSAEESNKVQEITINASALKAHLDHGDSVGTCSGVITTPISTPTISSTTITVLYPNGGEVLQKGTTQIIKWNSVNVSKIYIKLGKGNDTYHGSEGMITDVIPNVGGYYKWTVPTTLPDGNDYYIRIVDGNNTGIYDDTNAPFSIVTTTTQTPTPSATPIPSVSVVPTPTPTPTSSLSPCETSIPRPAGYITYDNCSDQEPAVVRRANGDIVSVFNSGGNGLAVSRGAVSHDGGSTWSLPQLAVSTWDDVDVIENTSGQLVLMALSSGTIHTWISTDGISWSYKAKISPTTINNSVGGIIQAKDGYYYASYHVAINSNNTAVQTQDTLITRSRDLITWETPVNVTNGTVYSNDSSLLQTTEGTLWLAYNLVTAPYDTVIMKSSDGQTWTRVVGISGFGANHGSVNLIEINGKPVVFGRMGFSTYYSYQLATGVWSQPQKILDNTPFGGEAVLLDGGAVGIAYAHIANFATDPSGQRDIRFANVGVLPITVTKSNQSNNLAMFSRNLTVGLSGNDVKQLQALLASEVSYPANLMTGYFGRITRNAVKKLQAKYGIAPISGYFDEKTQKALRALISGQ